MTKMMKALMKDERAPGLTLTEVEVPKIGPNDVLIKIKRLLFVVQIYTYTTGMSGLRRQSLYLWLQDTNLLE